jgi:hypothetical protein
VPPGRQTDHLAATALAQQVAETRRRLARRAGQHDGVGAEQVLLAEPRVEQERGRDQRPQQRGAGLRVGASTRVGALVALVDRRELGVMGRAVDEALGPDAGRFRGRLPPAARPGRGPR